MSTANQDSHHFLSKAGPTQTSDGPLVPNPLLCSRVLRKDFKVIFWPSFSGPVHTYLHISVLILGFGSQGPENRKDFHCFTVFSTVSVLSASLAGKVDFFSASAKQNYCSCLRVWYSCWLASTLLSQLLYRSFRSTSGHTQYVLRLVPDTEWSDFPLA